MWSRIFALFLFSAIAVAQTLAPAAPKIDNDFGQKEFGDSCSLVTQWPPIAADLNGDGVEDLLVVARCKNPLIDQDEKNYRVIDPLNSFFGYGNPAVTTGFASEDPKLRGISLLVIHGAGAEAWRSATPQAKFVIINVVLKTITVKKMKVKRRKAATAIYVEEAGGNQMTSAIFWDGKKYRYAPMGSSME